MTEAVRADDALDGKPEPARRWWDWHWDTATIGECEVPYLSLKRWRRGSLLTVYRWESRTGVKWWFYGPFNLAIGFAYERAT